MAKSQHMAPTHDGQTIIDATKKPTMRQHDVAKCDEASWLAKWRNRKKWHMIFLIVISKCEQPCKVTELGVLTLNRKLAVWGFPCKVGECQDFFMGCAIRWLVPWQPTEIHHHHHHHHYYYYQIPETCACQWMLKEWL